VGERESDHGGGRERPRAWDGAGGRESEWWWVLLVIVGMKEIYERRLMREKWI
jgi:hypothetical protein